MYLAFGSNTPALFFFSAAQSGSDGGVRSKHPDAVRRSFGGVARRGHQGSNGKTGETLVLPFRELFCREGLEEREGGVVFCDRMDHPVDQLSCLAVKLNC